MKRAKRILALVLAVITAGALFTGCGKGPDTEDGTYVLKMHMTVGATDPVAKSGEEFARLVSEKTGGKVTVELYPSSSLGVTQDCLEGLGFRACDIVYDSMSNMSTWTSLANIEACPYLYSSLDHFKAVWEGEVGDTIRHDVGEDAGLKIMGGGLQGIRVTTTNKPIHSVADVKGMKIRVPTIDIYLKTWSWLGAATTPLAGSEIFTAMQQGTVDGQENAYPTCVGLSLQEVSKYVTETNHVYSMTTFIMDQKFFDSLPEEFQTAIEESAVEAGEICTDLVEESAVTSKQVFIDAGVEILDVDFAEWQEAMDGFLEANYPELIKYYDMIQSVDPAKAGE